MQKEIIDFNNKYYIKGTLSMEVCASNTNVPLRLDDEAFLIKTNFNMSGNRHLVVKDSDGNTLAHSEAFERAAKNIPGIPDSVIKLYADKFNDDDIVNLNLLFEINVDKDKKFSDQEIKLLVNPDGNVNVVAVKDNWDANEVCDLFDSFIKDVMKDDENAQTFWSAMFRLHIKEKDKQEI